MSTVQYWTRRAGTLETILFKIVLSLTSQSRLQNRSPIQVQTLKFVLVQKQMEIGLSKCHITPASQRCYPHLGSGYPHTFFSTHGKAGLLFARPTGDISKHSQDSDVFLTNSPLNTLHTNSVSPFAVLKTVLTVPHIRWLAIRVTTYPHLILDHLSRKDYGVVNFVAGNHDYPD